MIHLTLPYHLRNLAGTHDAITLDVPPPVTLARILDALETRYPALRGTIRDHDSNRRRPMLRFFACSRDFSNEPMNTPLPEAIALGKEPFLIVGAIAGG